MLASQWFNDLLPNGSNTAAIATLALAVCIGVAVGNIRIGGVRLGVAAVLFSALLFAQFGLTIRQDVLEYFRDFALVLFVYALGLQMGPGFVSSFKAEGLRLNLLAVMAIVLGAITTAVIIKCAHLPRETAAGLFTGGFATTPALAAGEDALRQMGKSTLAADQAYSVAYPFGLTGPILLVLIFKLLFRTRVSDELARLTAGEQKKRPPTTVRDIEVTNPEMVGVALKDKCFFQDRGVHFTRMLRQNEQSVPTAYTAVALGDIFRAIGPELILDKVTQLLGQASSVTLAEATGNVQRADLVVTRKRVLGKSLRELDLINRHGVTLARVNRAGVDLPLRPGLTFHFGDSVVAVGPPAGLVSVENVLGNSIDALNQTQLIPIFLGIWLGVIVGSIPLAFPGLHTPVKIGLAGGPMLVAIALSRLGNVGSIVWYMPIAANQVLRDFGMAVFLACVGFQSGDHFFQKLVHGGLPLVGWGAIITILPMLVVGLFARWWWKINFITLSGLTAGAMTSSPTLLFANEITGSNAPAVAYAAVYPLSMLVPVFCSQLLVTMLL